jgi:phosphonate transport system ATP-binding protein
MTGFHVELAGVTARHPAASPASPPALDQVSLVVRPGEQVAVIGPSGAGKTTLLQVMAAALKPSDGSLILDQERVWALGTRRIQKLRGQLFYAPQTPPLPPRQRVVTALLAARLPQQSFLQSLATLVYPSSAQDAQDALKEFDLAEKLWDRVDRLSGGERQRVGLARALLAPARMWLIDEPLSALDPKRSQQAIDTLVRHAQARQVTLIATLHQVDVATTKFARVIGLRDGRLMFDLPGPEVTKARLAELYAQHEHELAQTAAAVLDTPAQPEPPKIIHCR